MNSIRLPITLVSEANLREHWAKRATRAKMQRGLVAAAIRNAKPAPGSLRWTIYRVIQKRGRIMDYDNLVRACKHVQDGIADGLGIDDKYLIITYYQRKSEDGQVGVEIAWQRE